ncbi:helix-turn-helix domain-containing protein [Sphingomonas sp. BK481]|jgi:DNA-binding transcriptional MerR regulator|uniref:MerR family transcriptional regulator n=1 Tax=Sphingomonas sp. BK481 TaxID=2586981 RepID=UPI001622EFEC|nr:helix-turn-helix domain-containing protein [Sphingomonas sp. BK481]MBB3588432.1 DNA-binding transcriptional MerR regulator [Sphingomonas sp. BK481]
MKIGEIAKLTGLKVETVRYYEGEGLIGAPRRNGGNYRLYDRSHLERLTFIKRSRDLGFTLDQVRDLLRLADDPRGSCDAVDEMAVVHIEEIDRKLADLHALRDEVATWGRCDATTIAECRLIDALSSRLP